VKTRSPRGCGSWISTLPGKRAIVEHPDRLVGETPTLDDFGARSWPCEHSAAMAGVSRAWLSRATCSPSNMPGWVTSSGYDFRPEEDWFEPACLVIEAAPIIREAGEPNLVLPLGTRRDLA
jgi:hypothetical protein